MQLFFGGIGWHTGVIGIVASKITDIYYKPSILLCFEEENNVGKGSGRSIQGFDLHDALMKCKDVLAGFGGHSMAVGLSVEKENFEKFKEQFLEITKEAKVTDLVPILNIDDTINLDDINKEMVKSLSYLEPFGAGNQMPIFAFKNLKIDAIRSLTEGKHLKLVLKSNKNNYVDAIGFNLGYLSNNYKIGDRIDIAGNLEINNFNGADSIQINIKDIMKSI